MNITGKENAIHNRDASRDTEQLIVTYYTAEFTSTARTKGLELRWYRTDSMNCFRPLQNQGSLDFCLASNSLAHGILLDCNETGFFNEGSILSLS